MDGRRTKAAGAWRRGRAALVLGVAALAFALVACSGNDDAAADTDDVAESSARGEMQTGAEGGAMGVFPSDAGNDGAAEEAAARGDSVAPAPAPGMASAPSESAAGGGTGGTTGIANTLGRTVIRSASVELRVESVADAFEEVQRIAAGAGGFVGDSMLTGTGDEQRARLSMRVPAEGFAETITQLRGLAVEVHGVSTSAQDVTEEYSDLGASLRNLQAVEAQYLTLLGQAEAIGDILQVQDRLSSVRYEIERVQGRMNLLDDLVDMAAIEVSLVPESVSASTSADPGFGERISEAWESSIDAIAAVGTGVVVAAVWSWWLVPLVLVAAFFARRYVQRSRSRLGLPDARVDTPEGAA